MQHINLQLGTYMTSICCNTQWICKREGKVDFKELMTVWRRKYKANGCFSKQTGLGLDKQRLKDTL